LLNARFVDFQFAALPPVFMCLVVNYSCNKKWSTKLFRF
jgi:hypothetical protein